MTSHAKKHVDPLHKKQAKPEEVLSQKPAEIEKKHSTHDDKIKELEHKNLRLYADMDNLHKQHTIDLDRYKKIGKRAVLDPLIGFLSTLHIAFSYAPQTDDKKVLMYVATLKSSFEKLKSELSEVGVAIVVPEKGAGFDPEKMRALNNSEDEKTTVKNVVSVGLSVDGQLITPATVMV